MNSRSMPGRVALGVVGVCVIAVVLLLASVPLLLIGVRVLRLLGSGAALLVFAIRGFSIARGLRNEEEWARLTAIGYLALFGFVGLAVGINAWRDRFPEAVMVGLVLAAAGAAGAIGLAPKSVAAHFPADIEDARAIAVSRLGVTMGLAGLFTAAGAIASVQATDKDIAVRIGVTVLGSLLLLVPARGVRRGNTPARIGFSVGLILTAVGGALGINDRPDAAVPQAILAIVFALAGLAALWVRRAKA